VILLLEVKINKNMSLETLMERSRIKIMHYNILHGFHKPEVLPFDPPYELNKDRLKATQEVTRVENPDVLVLTEACFGVGDEKDKGIKMDYGKLFSFPYYIFARRGDYEWGSAILSKYPILNLNNNKRGMRHYAEAILDFNGSPLTLGVSHPHPDLSEDEKLQYFKEVVPAKLPKRYILAGDFNSISDQDKYDRDEMIKGFRSFAENPELVVDEMLNRKVLPYLRSIGLVDSYKSTHPDGLDYTIPTDYLSKDKRSGMRMDFIMCSPDFLVEDAYVVKNQNAEKASDHYPVVAVLEDQS